MNTITVDLLKAVAYYSVRTSIVSALAVHLPVILPQYDIDEPLRLAHFLAQACEETAYFRTLVEYGSGTEYECRADLGNVEPGDGPRFKGRGIFQITGRANYKKYGDLIGVDLIADPTAAADPENAVWTACEFWDAHDLSLLADRDDIVDITRRINGGTNGLAEREAALTRAKTVLGIGGPK